MYRQFVVTIYLLPTNLFHGILRVPTAHELNVPQGLGETDNHLLRKPKQLSWLYQECMYFKINLHLFLYVYVHTF